MASSGSSDGPVAERGARSGVEEVERHLGGLELAQLRRAARGAGRRSRPCRAAHRSTAPCRAALHEPAGVGPLVPGVGRDDGGEERLRRLEVVVVAVHAALGQAPGLVLGQDAGADRHVEARSRRGSRGTRSRMRCMRALVGAAHGEHDAELGRAEGCRLAGRGEHLVGVEERGRLDRGVERDDCEQKWQSSGQPPVLADRMPSTSTSGPHQASRTSWASAASVRHGAVGQRGQRGELVAGERAAARRGGPFRPGRSRPCPPRSGRLGAGAAGCPNSRRRARSNGRRQAWWSRRPR